MQPVKILGHFASEQLASCKGKDLLRVDEFSAEELTWLLQFAAELKQRQKKRSAVSTAQREDTGDDFRQIVDAHPRFL